MLIVCSHCQTRSRVPASAAGKKGRCPHCGMVLTLPPAEAAPAEAAPAEAAGPPANTDPAAPAPAVAEGATVVAPTPRPDGGETQPPERSAAPAAARSYTFLATAQSPDEMGRLGPYRILRVLGQGGMGIVFLAEDVRLARQVAVKAMLPELAANPAARDRFLREARTAAAIEHDHIVAIYQVDEDRGVPYIAMPLLRGCSLEDWLRSQPPGPLPVPMILRWGRQVAQGLAAAHAHGLIHRDIKPANIFLQTLSRGPSGAAAAAAPLSATIADPALAPADSRVKILDFGLARSSAGDQHLTLSGVILGTPTYMAPEQARSGSRVDARADLFSLGVVLYRLATGRLPFHGEDVMGLLMALAMDQPPPPIELNSALPPALSDLIMRLLEKDPTRRPASADEVAQALDALEGAAPGPAGTGAQPVVPPRTSPPVLPLDETEIAEPEVPTAPTILDDEPIADAEHAEDTTLSLTSMIVGIASASCAPIAACCCFSSMLSPLVLLGGVAAIILGIFGLQRGGRNYAVIGITLGAAAVAAAAASLAFFVLGISMNVMSGRH